MLNLTLFRNRVFGFGNLSALFSFMSIYGVIFLTPFYLTFILHKDPLHMGLIMAAAPLATLFVAPLSGVFSDRVGGQGPGLLRHGCLRHGCLRHSALPVQQLEGFLRHH